MTEKLRIGVIGTSNWADRWQLPALHSHERAEMAAICGRNESRAREMAAKYDAQEVYTDYRAMIERARLDAVVVLSPDDMHYPMVMDALDAGLHILCEKPLALNAEDARAMYEKAEAKGVKHMVYFTLRFLPHAQYVRRLIEEGYVGRCYQADFRYIAPFGRTPRYGWRFDAARANGILADLGAHIIDEARWYVGEIVKVASFQNVFVERYGPGDPPQGKLETPANDGAVLAVQFANGAHGSIQINAVTHWPVGGPENRIGIFGQDGSLQVDFVFDAPGGGHIRGARSGDERVQTLSVPAEAWGGIDPSDPKWTGNLLASRSVGGRGFIDAILDDRPVSPTFYDGWKVQQVLNAALESQRTGRVIEIGE